MTAIPSTAIGQQTTISNGLVRRGNTTSTATVAADDLRPFLNRSVWLLVGFAGLFVGLRIFCKFWRQKRLWWDDYILIAGWVTVTTSASLISVCASLGLGSPSNPSTGDSFHTLLFYTELAGFFAIISAAWTKTSFAVTLLRISDGWSRRVVWFIIISVNIIIGASATIQWVQCWPIQKSWTPVPGSCWPRAVTREYNVFVSIYSGASDTVLALLPWHIIWKPSLSKKERLGVTFAMSMGIFAGAMSLAKIATLNAIGNSKLSPVLYLLLFGVAECAVTIIAASIPVLRTLFVPPRRPDPRSFVRFDNDQRSLRPWTREEKDGPAVSEKEDEL